MDTLGGIVSQMPFIRFVFPELSGYNKLIRILEKLWNFLDEEIKVHEMKLSNQPHDLIDAFLLEISNKKEDKNTIFDREYKKFIKNKYYCYLFIDFSITAIFIYFGKQFTINLHFLYCINCFS